MQRKKTKAVKIGGVTVGGGAPVSIQSMTNTDTRDIDATVAQIKNLEDAGCEIVRLAVPDMDAAAAISVIKKKVSVPIAADIHYDYRLALAALEAGADKLRLNPGNIGGPERVKLVAQAARISGAPIRAGVNSGSLEKDIYKKYGGVTPEGLAESAMREIEALESAGFFDIVISVKSSDVPLTIAAYEILAKVTDYPLHVGITEAGTSYGGSIKSAVGLGAILSRGLGDTIRVSLTDNPLEEIRCAKEILRALNLRRFGVEFISCPTCGRTQIDLIALAQRVEKYCENIKTPLKVAVMGCSVNGPGEAKDADIGIAGGKKSGVIFKKGEVYETVAESRLFSEFSKEIDRMTGESTNG